MNRRPLVRRARRRLFPLQFEAMESRLLLASLFVTSTADDGSTGTLRWAINQVNENPGPGTIDFDIPGTGVQTIAPLSPLPALTSPVTIDGTSQPGYDPNNPTPMIELTGNLITATGADGLEVSGGNSTIMGLVIDKFTGSGIVLDTLGDDTIVGNYIGLDSSGTKPGYGNGSDGIELVFVSGNTIGGDGVALQNDISGNGGDGIGVYGGSQNVILNNQVGTDVTGETAVANGSDGIFIYQSSNNAIGDGTYAGGNLVSGNELNGIQIVGPASYNSIQGNYVGPDLTGTKAFDVYGISLGNRNAGIELDDVDHTLIGGTTHGAGNLISNNRYDGLRILSGSNDNLVEYNIIGTDISGLKNLANSAQGVFIDNSFNNTIGAPAAGNNISLNQQEGVAIRDSSYGNLVQSNTINGNFLDGLFIDSGSHDNQIGGTNSNTANTISANERFGIFIDGVTNSTVSVIIKTQIVGNQIIYNFGGGISISSADQTTIEGNAVYGNNENGIELQTGVSATTIAVNLISENNLDGILIENGAFGTVVEGNDIGTAPSGQAGFGNGAAGVAMNDGPDNTIGGATAGEGNIREFPGNNLILIRDPGCP